MNADLLRPICLAEFVGQEGLINRLTIHANAALAEIRPMEHTLLAGPPGSGKTALAHLIADLLGDELETLIMPVSEQALKGAVTGHNGVLFLDEAHAASSRQQEALLPLLEFGYIQAKSGYRIEAGFLTIVAATTEPEKIIQPLYDRFKIKPMFEEYTEEEMGLIVRGMAVKANLNISEEDADILGKATGGTPRNGGEFVLSGKALEQDLGRTPSADEILEFCDVDRDGLTRRHYMYLEALEKFGGCRGVKAIANVTRFSDNMCTDLERLLFKLDLITYGNTGRELLSAGYAKVAPTSRSDETCKR